MPLGRGELDTSWVLVLFFATLPGGFSVPQHCPFELKKTLGGSPALFLSRATLPRFFGLLVRLQRIQVVRRLLRKGCRCENRALVPFQDIEP